MPFIDNTLDIIVKSDDISQSHYLIQFDKDYDDNNLKWKIRYNIELHYFQKTFKEEGVRVFILNGTLELNGNSFQELLTNIENIFNKLDKLKAFI